MFSNVIRRLWPAPTMRPEKSPHWTARPLGSCGPVADSSSAIWAAGAPGPHGAASKRGWDQSCGSPRTSRRPPVYRDWSVVRACSSKWCMGPCTTRRSVYWPALWRGLTAGSAPSPLSVRLSSRSLHESPSRIHLPERSLREDRWHPRQRFDGAIGLRKYLSQTLHDCFKFLRRRTAAQAESDRAHADLWTHAHRFQDR